VVILFSSGFFIPHSLERKLPAGKRMSMMMKNFVYQYENPQLAHKKKRDGQAEKQPAQTYSLYIQKEI
jgi:hypothetical protein